MEMMSLPSVEIMWKLQKSCGVLVETMWCQHGNYVVSTWKPHGVHLETTWCPHLKPCGVQTMCPCGNHETDMKTTRKPQICSFQANFKPQSRQAMEITLFPHEMTLFSSCVGSPWKGHHFHP